MNKPHVLLHAWEKQLPFVMSQRAAACPVVKGWLFSHVVVTVARWHPFQWVLVHLIDTFSVHGTEERMNVGTGSLVELLDVDMFTVEASMAVLASKTMVVLDFDH